MDLQIFNTTNCVTANTRANNGVRSIGIHQSSRSITFAQMTVKDLGIKVGGKVLFAQDNTKGDFYLCVTDNPDGFLVRSKKCGQNISVYICNRVMTEKMLTALKANVGATCLIAKKPVSIDGAEWYKVITSKPLRVK